MIDTAANLAMTRTSPAPGTSSLRMSPPWMRLDVTVMAVLFVVGLLVALVLAPWWLDPWDDGLYMHQANVLLRGGVPYRDYLLHDPPLGTAWHALMLALFGNDLLVLRLAVVPFKALILPAVYALSRPLVPRGPAVLAALVVPVMDSGSYYNVAHIALNALGLAFVVVVLLMVWERHPSPGWLVAAGIVLGLMTGFKQNMGFFVLAGVALWLAEAPPLWGSPKSKVQSPKSGLKRLWTLDFGLATTIGAWGAATLGAVWLVRAHPEPNVLISLVLPIAVLAVAAVVRSLNWRKESLGTRVAGVGEANGEESGEEPPMPGDSGPSSPALRQVLLRWAALGAGFLAATLPWLVWAGLGVGLPALVNNLLIVPGELPKLWFVALRQPVPAFWWVLGLYLGGAVVAAACLALTRLLGGTRRGSIAAWAGLALWGAALVFVAPLRENATTGVIYFWIYFNLLVFWPAFLLIELLPADVATLRRRTHARLLLITATLLALEMYPHLRRVHSNWCFPLFLPLAAWLLWEAVVALRRIAAPAARRFTGAVPALAVALLPALAIWWILDWRVSPFVDLSATFRTGRFTPAPSAWLDLPHFHTLELPDKAAFHRRVADAITSRTRPGEPIYCLYREIAYYLATERPPAVLNVYAPPETTLADAEAMTQELERAKVRVILVDNAILSPDGPRDPFFSINVVSWAVPLRNYLVYNFRKVEDLDSWSLWERK